MPIFTTQNDYSTAVSVNRDTASRRFAGLPFDPVAGGPRRYPLASVLPTVKPTERAHVPALFAAATEEAGCLFVGEGVLPACHKLVAWLDAAQGERLYRVQVDFTEALARGLQTSHIFEHLDALRLKLILHPGALRFVVLGDASALPNFKGGFPIQFAITNARYEPIFTEMETV